MRGIEVAYRHSSSTGRPEGLTPADVWQVAQRTRMQMCEGRLSRCVPVDGVAERLAEIEVNGLRFEASWDLDHPVVNASGKPVMGVTEYDKASPRCVMVSVNGPMLANAETLLRSTIDLVEAGIIDPTKVVRVALENAVSVASVLLLTEATMTEFPEPAKARPLEPEMSM